MEHFDYILVGGGVASAICAKTLREKGEIGSIAIFCAESFFPYNRPPLSKGLLLNYEKEENIFAYPQSFYDQNNIEIKLNTPIKSLVAAKNVIIDNFGNQYSFKKLLVATGATVRKIPLQGSNLQGVFYLRNLKESRAIKVSMKKAKNAVIIGSGFIGMELASAFVQSNIKTTMLVRENKIFEKMASATLSSFFQKYYESRGVKIIFEDQASKIVGQDKAQKVITQKGAELTADIVAIGVGVRPEVNFLEGSGVQTDNGVVVNKFLESESRSNVFAAGDVANYFDIFFDKRRRVEHWDHAKKQGKAVALNMLGQEKAYDRVAYFYSDMFDLSWEFIGDNSDIDETLLRGSFENQDCILFFFKENILKAAFLLMQGPEQRQACEKLIISRKDLTLKKEKLLKTDFWLEG